MFITYGNAMMHPYQPKIDEIQNIDNQPGYKIPLKGTVIGEQ
jgi:hypothetical protein